MDLGALLFGLAGVVGIVWFVCSRECLRSKRAGGDLQITLKGDESRFNEILHPIRVIAAKHGLKTVQVDKGRLKVFHATEEFMKEAGGLSLDRNGPQVELELIVDE